MAAQVENDGTISAPDGQVAMAAGRDFVLQQGFSESTAGASGAVTGNTTATTLGIEVAVQMAAGLSAIPASCRRRPVTSLSSGTR